MSHVTTHVLDTALGLPAANVPVALLGADGEILGAGITNSDGRIPELGPEKLEPGNYSLVFDTEAYFAQSERDSFFPWVTIDFKLDTAAHYHVPLLLSPFAYSTYRGS